MAVNHVTTWQYKPGALPEVIARMSKSKATHERMGAKVRAFQATTAGVNVRRLNYTLRFDNHRAWAEFARKAASDAEWQSQWQEIERSDITTLFGQLLAVEVAGFEASPLPAGGGPRARIGTAWQVAPGRLEDALQLFAELKDLVQRFGASFSAVRVLFAGPASGQLVTISEYADAEAVAAAFDDGPADAAWVAANARFGSAGSPVSLLSRALSFELPI